jgi:hypothetical protein
MLERINSRGYEVQESGKHFSYGIKVDSFFANCNREEEMFKNKCTYLIEKSNIHVCTILVFQNNCEQNYIHNEFHSQVISFALQPVTTISTTNLYPF